MTPQLQIECRFLSRVEGRGSRVEGRGSRVTCRGSRYITRFFNNLMTTLQNENLDEEENIIVVISIAKRTKSKNRMQITEFLARLGSTSV